MRIIVTGATGFLGTTLCRRLQDAGHAVTRLGSSDADLRQRGSLDRFTDRFDQIYHLAAWTQAGDFCLKHPGEQWIINQLMNTHVLEWWQSKQPQAKLITMGTSCSYSPDLPLEEENYLKGTPIDSLFTYAHTKRMLLVGQMALQKQYGLQWLTLVPSTLYGPGYHTDGRQMHFIFDLIRKILRAKLYGETVVLWGDGLQKRELIYVEDFVSVASRIAHECKNEVINIGAGEEFTIKHFATLICTEIGYDFSRIQFDTARYVGAKSKCLHIERLKQIIPGLHACSLGEGLKTTISWFHENKESLLPRL
jgi:GDP-L-fucose synthase